MKRIFGFFLLAVGLAVTASGCDLFTSPLPTPTIPPLAEQGRRVFERTCTSCHSTAPDMIVVGPSLAGIATRGVTRIEGMTAEAYIRDSIMNPTNYTVEGFREGIMPDSVYESLTTEEFEALVDYLMTLK
jgi:nitric oxide reductase subunit C